MREWAMVAALRRNARCPRRCLETPPLAMKRRFGTTRALRGRPWNHDFFEGSAISAIMKDFREAGASLPPS
jgi:hypothetical protein